MLQKNMPPINAFCINCNILIKPQSVDAFCTKNFSLMQNASTLPTHFVTKKSKYNNCNIGAKCVVSEHQLLLKISSQKRILRSANLLKDRESSCFMDEEMN